MSKYFLLIFSLALYSTLAQGAATTASLQKPQRKLSNKEKRRQKRLEQAQTRAEEQIKQFSKDIEEISTLFGPILEAYHKVKKCEPKEYPYYLNELKATINKEVETGKFNIERTTWQVCEFDGRGYKAVPRCRMYLIPQARRKLLAQIESCKNEALNKKAQALLDQLKDLQRIIDIYN